MRYYPNFFTDDFFGSTSNHSMACDIYETENDYQLTMDLPGFKKEDLEMSLEDGYLNISAKRAEKVDENRVAGRYVRQERYHGTYQRSFYVGKELLEEDIKAAYQDGVLYINVPKAPKHPQPSKKMIPID